MSWNEQISFRQHAKGGWGLKGMQLCSSGENVRWKIDQSEAKLVPFAMFRSATRRNCRTFPCDFIQQICTIFISFSFPLFFLVIFVSFFVSCCSLLVSISWINQREFTIFVQVAKLNWAKAKSEYDFHLPLELWVSVTGTASTHSYGSWEVVLGVAFKMHINGVALITRPRRTLLHKDERLKRLCVLATRVQHEQQVEYIVATYVWVSPPLPHCLPLPPLGVCLGDIKTQSPSAIPAHKNGCKNGKQ